MCKDFRKWGFLCFLLIHKVDLFFESQGVISNLTKLLDMNFYYLLYQISDEEAVPEKDDMIPTRDVQPSKSPKLKRTIKRKAPPVRQKHGKYIQRSTYIVTLSPLKGVCFHTWRGGDTKGVESWHDFQSSLLKYYPPFLTNESLKRNFK